MTPDLALSLKSKDLLASMPLSCHRSPEWGRRAGRGALIHKATSAGWKPQLLNQRYDRSKLHVHDQGQPIVDLVKQCGALAANRTFEFREVLLSQ